MSGVQEKLTGIFKSRSAGPFLFVGSGFSRRYLGLEDWKGLLQRFCSSERPFEYYLATANGSYPEAAKLLAKDFHHRWWSESQYADSLARFGKVASRESSALRIEICQYLATLDQGIALRSEHSDEVDLLAKLNVDGVITTNWDMFLEQIFPDYRVYVGQNELLFATPQEIGEIYKIHGGCNDPDSLVLTVDDYNDFAERNVYLAAKLITVFVEHPVIFLGYSLSDENIKGLLRSISLCIGKDQVEKLRKNLIFVQRIEGADVESVSDTYFTVEGVQIPLVLVKTDDFSAVYRAIDSTKRKIPARVLRLCKEQMYEIVKSGSPEKKLCVVGMDELSKAKDIEFLVGVGVASGELSEIGYSTIDAADLLNDLLVKDRRYDPKQILAQVIKVAGRNSKNVPVFKYLYAEGVRSLADYNRADLKLDKWVVRPIREYRSTTYAGAFRRNYKASSISEIIESCTPENAAAYIPFLAADKIDLDVLNKFLVNNLSKMDYSVSSYASSFRKLASLYDRLKWGW
ncbi:SIR2 family protein [Stenotrophomonas indicatrix]|uniref:SIR2 family protein n=1 Tax=Stenotrophomonas indicatrix TaxID=2045451 RepID=UPI00215ADB14|nr:SIR2 family protein [Stenotrophomonas indicatrix]MCR8714827.1 SIR2 family protein [Stenotrophomonas indicatrix]